MKWNSRTLFRTVVLVGPVILVLALISVRRYGRQSSGGDPTILNPQYSNIVWKLNQGSYHSLDSLSVADISRIPGFESLELMPRQKALLTTNLFNLISAHKSGEAQFLRQVLLPTGQDQFGWSFYATRRLPIILRSGGLAPQDITNAMQNPSWDIIKRAWEIMVAEHKLTNWWYGISWEQCQAWAHHAGAQATPPNFESGLYGEFAGTVTGTSLLSYSPEVPRSPVDSQTVAAVRIVLKFYGREKPIIYVFRWRWDQEKDAWYPLDQCIGVVGRRAPNPFF
jgi:hypothetical protein